MDFRKYAQLQLKRIVAGQGRPPSRSGAAGVSRHHHNLGGTANERTARPPGASGAADRGIAAARLRQRRNRATAQHGPADRQGPFQPAFSAFWNHQRHQASKTRDTLVSEAAMFGGARYGKRVPSERESRVIELVAQGLKNKEVADEIGTTEHVVKNYLESSMTSSDSGTGSSLPSGTKHGDTSKQPELEPLEAWERSILGLHQTTSPG